MKLNLNKTKITVFRNGGILKQIEKWYFEGVEIEIVSVYKYLGLYFTPKLIRTKTTELLAKQYKKQPKVFSCFKENLVSSILQTPFNFFDSMVNLLHVTVLKFWGCRYREEIEKIPSTFCKQYVGLKQNTNDAFAIGGCGRLPLAVTYMAQAIKYWLKLPQMPNKTYPRQC